MCVCRSSYRHLTEDDMNSPEERKKRESYDQLIDSKLGLPAATTHDFEEDYSTPEYELYMKMMMGMKTPMQANVMMSQLPSLMTIILVLKWFCQKEMTWFQELSNQRSRILRDSLLEGLIRILSWTHVSTMLNSLMVRLQSWVQTSLQNACMLSVTLKEINIGSWITRRMVRQFPNMTKRLHQMARYISRRPPEGGSSA